MNQRNTLPLSKDQVDLWLVFTDEIQDEALLARYQDLLTPQEKQQQARFHFPRDRHRYLLTRALVREMLSRYAPIAPQDWRFEPSAYGRPLITNEHPHAPAISFNISHTQGLIMLGVVRDRALGVDTETQSRDAPLEIADRYFSQSESAALHALPAAMQRQRFFELWTLKESYIKARGMGLSIPLDQFSFDLARAGRVALEFESGFDDTASRWRFWQWQVSDHHLAALCLEIASNESVTVTARRAIPLVREHEVELKLLRTSA
ncbi:4'-phosphopantetheinyl transferase superfamily protein [soil metagenome]